MKKTKNSLLSKGDKTMVRMFDDEAIQMEQMTVKQEERSYSKLEDKNEQTTRQNYELKNGYVGVQQKNNKETKQLMSSQVKSQFNYQPVNQSYYNTSNQHLYASSVSQAAYRPQPTTIPQMVAKCNFCTLDQHVPSTTNIFKCWACRNTTQCVAQYGFFQCKTCKRQVCYPYGVSEFIRCICCNTVNTVSKDNPISQKLAQKVFHSSVNPSKQKFTQEQDDYYPQI